jgi:opacity protein-like surface antigen
MRSVGPILALAAGAVLSIPAFAQNPSNPASPMTATSARAPWYGGISVGEAKLDNDKETAYRAFAGTRFNQYLGVELGVANLGKFGGGGVEAEVWAADIGATAGIPLGTNASVFAKLGAAYTETKVSGLGLTNGKEREWSPRWGVGGQLGLSPNWALRLDWDRYQDVAFAGGRDQDLDTLMLGAQYTFR